MSQADLDTLRQQIDELDENIQALITQRACLAQSVAKAKYAEEDDPSFYRPEREAEILHKVLTHNKGPLPDAALTLLFREIISACRALQKPQSIAYLGPPGTYSQLAVLKHFGHAVDSVPLQTIEEVFREVESGNTQYGVVPIENSTEGGVNQTMDCLLQTPLVICGEVELPVRHALLSKEKDLSIIKRIYSHPQSLAQCRVWLDTHLPSAERIAVSSNADAARRTASESHSAAIASEVAAELYELEMLATGIQTNTNNTTRFVVIGQKQLIPRTGQDRTSILLMTSRDHPGALYKLLEAFAVNNLNMTRLESRPSPLKMWEYIFFVDIEGHEEDPAVKTAFNMLQQRAALTRHLGSYPRTVC